MAKAGLSAYAMEFMPRITRAQVMDILSSQANLAGYRAVIDGARRIWSRHSDDDDGGRHGAGSPHLHHGRRCRRSSGHRHRPPPRRRGWTATDVRPATKEQVESLGAKFLAVEDDEFKQPRPLAAMPRKCRKSIRPSRPS